MADPDEVQLGKLAKKILAMPPKNREDSKLGKPRAPKRKDAPHVGAMIVFDVEILPNGDVAIGKPYKRFPNGKVAAIIAS
jgi:hypothetical protein